MSTPAVSAADVAHIAHLATIPVTSTEAEKLAQAFVETLAVVDQLQTIDVSAVQATSQVTGFTNIWRDDVVVEKNMFSQAQALANAAKTHEGYFVVPGLLTQKDS
jgi:aspartyl-tRNA(Asn)/glutamyl-tRNA(Gln) amidotransferase subunit C